LAPYVLKGCDFGFLFKKITILALFRSKIAEKTPHVQKRGHNRNFFRR